MTQGADHEIVVFIIFVRHNLRGLQRSKIHTREVKENVRNETSQIPVTGPGTCLMLVSI